MGRPKLKDHQRLALQAVRISPLVKERLAALPSSEKKDVIIEMRKAVERIIIAMTDKTLSTDPEINHFR
jgi:hypothetical protein